MASPGNLQFSDFMKQIKDPAFSGKGTAIQDNEFIGMNVQGGGQAKAGVLQG